MSRREGEEAEGNKALGYFYVDLLKLASVYAAWRFGVWLDMTGGGLFPGVATLFIISFYRASADTDRISMIYNAGLKAGAESANKDRSKSS